MKKKKLLIDKILTRLLANLHRQQLTEFVESAEILGYHNESTLCLLRYLQQGGKS